MALIRGPFSIKWGDNVLTDVEEINLEHEVKSEEFETVQGKNIEIDGSYKVNATLTLLASDIASLSALFPQYFVANGGILSTGETVNNAQGAIDVKAASNDDEIVYNNLDIISAGTPPQILRIVNARTRIEGIEVDNVIQKVMIKFIGESASDEASIQIFKQGTVSVIS